MKIFRRRNGEQGGYNCDRYRDDAGHRSKPQRARQRTISSSFGRASEGLSASHRLKSQNDTQHMGDETQEVYGQIETQEDGGIPPDEVLVGGPRTERSTDGDAGDTEMARSYTGNVRSFIRGQKRQSSGTYQGLNRDPRTSESRPPGMRSPSLSTKLRLSFRRVLMGRGSLGVRFPRHDDELIAHPSEVEREDSTDSLAPGGKGRRKREKHAEQTRKQQSGIQKRGHVDFSESDKDVEGDKHSSKGFDSDASCSGGSRVSIQCRRNPRSLPEAVQTYINDRTRIEQEMSASGQTVFDQLRSFKLRLAHASTRRESRRGGSLDISKEASSTTQLSGEYLPFTEAMFKAGVSETLHSTKQGILLEGDLYKFSPESVRGVRWHKRYFVLFAVACELRYYKSYVSAAWGRIPLGERGSIPLRLVVKIEQPSNKKYRGCRFDLVVLHRGEGRHPGLQISPGRESQYLTTKIFKLSAANAQQRLLWVTVIEALMESHGWGIEAARFRSVRAPGHGVTRGSPHSKSLVSDVDRGALPIQSGVVENVSERSSCDEKPMAL